jgi:hypothetical protein
MGLTNKELDWHRPMFHVEHWSACNIWQHLQMTQYAIGSGTKTPLLPVRIVEIGVHREC